MRIETLTHHGMGKTTDGQLIPRTLPGEEVDTEGRILSPSPDRVAAPCRHFKSCGGCSVQHASDSFVATWKLGIVEKALAARGLDALLRRLHSSPAQARRRAKFSGRRTKKGALVGFHARASDIIIPVPDCLVLRPALRALLPALEELTRRIASRKGELGLTLIESSSGVDLLVEQAKPIDEDRGWLADWARGAGLARLSVDGETIVTLVPPRIALGPVLVTPPPGAFLQATHEGQAALILSVEEAVSTATTIADLFCGCGTFALPLAQRAEIHAVEGAAPLLDALAHGTRHSQGLKPVTTEQRDLFRNPLTTDELARFDALVLDPPRAGAEAQVAQIMDTPQVAMVSCNPITFARDADALISKGYRLNWVDVVDQFRWSAHVELVGSFTRN